MLEYEMFQIKTENINIDMQILYIFKMRHVPVTRNHTKSELPNGC